MTYTALNLETLPALHGFSPSLDCYDGRVKARIIDHYPHYLHTVSCPRGTTVHLGSDVVDNIKDITYCDSAELHRWLYQREAN